MCATPSRSGARPETQDIEALARRPATPLASRGGAARLRSNGPRSHNARVACVGEHVVREIALAVTLPLMTVTAALAQPCNPVIDGTYCAEDAAGRSNLPARRPQFAPIQNLGSDIISSPDNPGTFGAITFQGGIRCIGLLRRSECN